MEWKLLAKAVSVAALLLGVSACGTPGHYDFGYPIKAPGVGTTNK